MFKRFLLVFIIIIPGFLYARDVDLDAIYLNTDSKVYKDIIAEKFESHRIAGSLIADSKVVSAVWAGPALIAYVTEHGSFNRLILYNTRDHEKSEITRFGGTVTSLQSRGRGYVLIKRMFIKKGLPRGETIWFNPATASKGTLPGSSPFADFTLSPDGDSIFIRGSEGIYEHRPESGTRRLYLEKSKYSPEVSSSGETVLAYKAPGGSHTAVLSGSGGSYKGAVISSGGAASLSGVTSGTEFFWIDSSRILFRGGGVGAFRAEIYDVNKDRKKPLITGSLNTNIGYSTGSGQASFLDNQLVCIYDTVTDELFRFGIEGDDPAVSPDGRRLISLFQNRLFLIRVDSLKRADSELKRHAEKLVDLYRKALADTGAHKNEYTPQYLRTKIKTYESYAGNR